MAGFDDVTLEWGGQGYRIPAREVLRVVCLVEDALILHPDENAIDVLLRKRPPARIARAFEVALRAAGAPVAEGEVHLEMMQALAEGSPDAFRATMEAVLALLALMAPPLHSRLLGTGSEDGGKKSLAG